MFIVPLIAYHLDNKTKTKLKKNLSKNNFRIHDWSTIDYSVHMYTYIVDIEFGYTLHTHNN